MTEQDKVTVDDIIGIVKTDGQTNSVQLKKEAQLSICEKRLIELEKENEQLQEQRAELFIRERDTKNEWRELKQENESLKEENKFLRNKVATYKKGNALLKSTLDKEWK